MWTIEWDSKAVKSLKKFDRQARQQIVDYLESRIVTERDPRRFGKALSGDKSGLALSCGRLSHYLQHRR